MLQQLPVQKPISSAHLLQKTAIDAVVEEADVALGSKDKADDRF
jgi:hypothetical protein